MSEETSPLYIKNLSTPRRILGVICQVFATLVMGGFVGFMVWIAATQFELPAILTAVLTGGSGLIGAAVGWRWWYRVIDGLMAGL